MDRLNDDVVRSIILMFVGDKEIDKFVGTLGGVNKRFLRLSRDRAIWERFYYLLFPAAKFKPTLDDITHLGPCSYSRCGVGWRRSYQVAAHPIPYPMNNQSFIQIHNYHGDAYHTGVRCDNPDHYPEGTFLIRRAKSRFKNMFKRSAMRYYTVRKKHHVGEWAWVAAENKRKIEKLKDEITLFEGLDRASKRFHASFIDEYKPKPKPGLEFDSSD